MADTDSLEYSNNFWLETLPPDKIPSSMNQKVDLIISLVIYLTVPLHHLLFRFFSCDINSVKTRATRFMAYKKADRGTQPGTFHPSSLYQLWHDRWPSTRAHLHATIVQPCAEEIMLQESNQIIKEPAFQIRLRDLTIAKMRELLSPDRILQAIRAKAPFTFGVLHVFAASPNAYRRRRAREKEGLSGDTATAGVLPDDELDGDSRVLDSDSGGESDGEGNGEDEGFTGAHTRIPGFSRNPVYVVMVAICMCAFARNRATNVLALPLGLFLKISGTSERVLNLLSNIGLSVSSTTVERIKERISEDAVQQAIALITSGSLFLIIFDNINLYLRKFQERISNRHTMIHATNAAVIAISEGDPAAVEDLDAKLKRRGERIRARFEDVRPSAEDGAHMKIAFECIIAELIVRYAPGCKEWSNRAEMLETIAGDMPHDRPLPPEKTDTRPFGVLNVNEGSKKGIINVMEELQKKSTLSEDEWSSKVRIIEGDWLTSNNIRSARRERKDDISNMHRLSYIEELSALWHFALNATHMIMRAYFGNAITNPASLAAHKGLLRRTWDVNKPNYAAAKALIRHSLIARILRSIMVLENISSWSALGKWRPTYVDIRRLARKIVDEYTLVDKARAAQRAGDDWLASEVYFMRDALLFCVFEDAVSMADAGVVLRVLKFWALAFRGASQHNYARECVEIILRWKYELSPGLQAALERSWFVNRWGLAKRWIAADLYLEQCNFWVKRVFIASGSGVTIEYIMKKGSACVEAFRDVAHKMARLFGDSDSARRSKESAFGEDMRVLVEEMTKRQSHILAPDKHFVPAQSSKRAQKSASSASPQSAVVDVMASGAAIWQNGKFQEFLKTTTYDPAAGYPIVTERDGEHDSRLNSDTAFDNCQVNVLETDEYVDLHGGEETEDGGPGNGALGGGDEYATGTEAF